MWASLPDRRALPVLFVLLLLAPSPSHAAAAGCVHPGGGLTQAVNQAAPNSTVCLAPGTYTPGGSLHPASGVTVRGMGKRRRDVRITTTHLSLIFDLKGSTGVTITNLTISGAVNGCPGSNCGPTGDGINGGYDVTVHDVRITRNGRTGIVNTSGLTVTDSRIDHNGWASERPDFVSAGIKSINPTTVLDSRVDHNKGNGIHCDLDCGAFTVRHSQVNYNTLTGIHVELNRGPALIGHNTVRYNNTLDWVGHSGIQIVDSKNATVRYNVLGYNGRNGILIREDSRASTSGYQLANVVVYGNKRHGDAVGHCHLQGVKCGK